MGCDERGTGLEGGMNGGQGVCLGGREDSVFRIDGAR